VEFSEKYGYNEGLFIEAQFHLTADRIQLEVIAKMTDCGSIRSNRDGQGIYRAMNPKIVAQVF